MRSGYTRGMAGRDGRSMSCRDRRWSPDLRVRTVLPWCMSTSPRRRRRVRRWSCGWRWSRGVHCTEVPRLVLGVGGVINTIHSRDCEIRELLMGVVGSSCNEGGMRGSDQRRCSAIQGCRVPTEERVVPEPGARAGSSCAVSDRWGFKNRSGIADGDRAWRDLSDRTPGNIVPIYDETASVGASSIEYEV